MPDNDQSKTVLRICAEMRQGTVLKGTCDYEEMNRVLKYNADRIEEAYREELKYMHEINQTLICTLKTALDQLTYYKQVVSADR